MGDQIPVLWEHTSAKGESNVVLISTRTIVGKRMLTLTPALRSCLRLECIPDTDVHRKENIVILRLYQRQPLLRESDIVSSGSVSTHLY